MEKVKCEYLLDNRLCGAIAEDEEGKALREASCTNVMKSFCCYLCANQAMCEISCAYLSEQDDTIRRVKSLEKNLKSEIDKCVETIEKLSTLFAEGKVDKQLYLSYLTTLETEIDHALNFLSLKDIDEQKKELESSSEVVDSIKKLGEPEVSKIVAVLVLPDGKELTVNKKKIIGREDLVNYVSSTESWWISREHCVVFEEDGSFYLRDDGSVNGTKLNDVEIKGKGKQRLKDGDEIVIADKVELTFKIEP